MAVNPVRYQSDLMKRQFCPNSGVPQVPDRYVLPPSQRPALGSSLGTSETTLPVIDLSLLHQPFLRSLAIHEISMACGREDASGVCKRS